MTCRSILITCMGTRGDVQPFIALSLGLLERGWRVTVAAPEEFKDFIEEYGISYVNAGISLQQEILNSTEGKALRTAGPIQILTAARAFFNVELFESWYRSIASHCRRLMPDVLLLTSFTQLCGAAMIPRLYALANTRVMVAHTVPMRPTSEFAVPLSGIGFSTRWGLLNKLQWATTSMLVGHGIHTRTAQEVLHRAARELQEQYQTLMPGPGLELGRQFGLEGAPSLYIYSPSLLPKPADWPDTCHVVGPLLLRRQLAHQRLAEVLASKQGSMLAPIHLGCASINPAHSSASAAGQPPPRQRQPTAAVEERGGGNCPSASATTCNCDPCCYRHANHGSAADSYAGLTATGSTDAAAESAIFSAPAAGVAGPSREGAVGQACWQDREGTVLRRLSLSEGGAPSLSLWLPLQKTPQEQQKEEEKGVMVGGGDSHCESSTEEPFLPELKLHGQEESSGAGCGGSGNVEAVVTLEGEASTGSSAKPSGPGSVAGWEVGDEDSCGSSDFQILAARPDHHCHYQHHLDRGFEDMSSCGFTPSCGPDCAVVDCVLCACAASAKGVLPGLGGGVGTCPAASITKGFPDVGWPPAAVSWRQRTPHQAGAGVGEAAVKWVEEVAATPVHGLGFSLGAGGVWVERAEAIEESVGLPLALQAFLDAAFRSRQHVVYIGLGSMLGTVFDNHQVCYILKSITEAVGQLSAKLPVRAVVHASLGARMPSWQGEGQRGGRAGSGPGTHSMQSSPCQPLFLLEHPVPHDLLLPQCSLVVHHGGAGTVQATLSAGKPALVVPCVPASDQAFWADLIWRRGLGPQWFPVRQLNPSRLAAGIEEGLCHLDRYTRNAEALAAEMHQEDGVGTAIAVIESVVGAAVPHGTC